MFKLNINTETIRVSKTAISTQVFSQLYFQINDTFFPAEYWDDFSVIVLNWWLREARHMVEGFKSTFSFMDGPYFFDITLKNNICKIDFIEDIDNIKKLIISIEITYDDYLKILKKSVNQLLRNLPPEAQNLKEVEDLKSEFKLLQKK